LPEARWDDEAGYFLRCHRSSIRYLALVIAPSHVTMIFVMSDSVTFSKALADATRWRILHLVIEEALCVCELADILDMPQSSVSSHVQVIRKAGLLESEKCEKWTYFRVRPAFRKLLRGIEKSFPYPDAGQLVADAAGSARRLETRRTSCCPGPKQLVKRLRTAAACCE
jgi:ArsR family transcriptional regulator, arsenate/arsenite/antimonite-responsive transcriptional repressor